MNTYIKLSFLAFFGLIDQTANAQYCTAIGPSTAADSNIESVLINGESSSQISYTGCPGIIGLEDLTGSENVILDGGTSYTLNVQFGTCGGNYGGAGEAWIDYNGDQTFDASESIGTWSGTPPVALSNLNFTVPPTIIAGDVRMRVLQHEGGALPLQPCANYTWGSVVDFSVTLTGGIDCSGYIGDDFTDPRVVSALPFQESYANNFCYTNVHTVYSSPDVFYMLNVADFEFDYINVSLCGSSFDTYLSVLDIDTNVLFVNDDYAGCGTQSELTFPTNGLDTVFIVVQGWGSEQGSYEIEINDGDQAGVSIGNNELLIYPNPALNELFISGLQKAQYYDIFDLSGKRVSSGIANPNAPIQIEYLETGLYVIQLASENEQLQYKFYKQ